MAFVTLECGLDEAGRGPLAGPVTASCVILPADFPSEILNDSKQLSPKKRALAEPVIKKNGCWGFARVEHDVIDKINILQASLLAMKLAYEDMLKKLPEWAAARGIELMDDVEKQISAVVDGNKCPDINCSVRCEPKADGKYPQVMAASIIAKEERDRIMIEYDKLYPEYGYAGHKGYPTPAHKALCRKIGPSPIQRLTFSIEEKKK